MEQIKVKSIAFNLADPHQLKLFNHSTNTTNFSSYIKSLIQRDMNSEYAQPRIVEIDNNLDFDNVKGLI